MSNNNWERGSVLLPSAARTQVLTAIREAMNAHHVQVRNRAIEMHKSIGTRSTKKYRAALFSRFGGDNSRKPRVQRIVDSAAFSVLYQMLTEAERGRVTIHVPTVADVDMYTKRVTNRDTSFSDGGSSLSIDVNGRRVTWDCEGNHGVESAHESVLGRAFFGALDKVTWTRGTGGHAYGNDEYNSDPDNGAGAGANYTTVTYGPLGDAIREAERRSLLASYGF